MSKSRLLLTIVGVLCGAIVGVAMHTSADAEHPDKLTPEADILRSFDVDRFGRAGKSAGKIEVHDVHAIARNPINSTAPQQGVIPSGGPVPVCAESKFGSDTQKAINFWNDGLPVPMFNWVSTDLADCDSNNRDSRYELSSVVIREYDPSKFDPCGQNAGACAKALRVWVDELPDGTWTQHPWNALMGQTTIWMNVDNWTEHYDETAGAYLGFGGRDGASRVAAKKRDAVALIAHELGHAFGLAHPYGRLKTGAFSTYTIEGTDYSVEGCADNFVVNGNPVGEMSGGRYGFEYEESGSTGGRREQVFVTDADARVMRSLERVGGYVMEWHPSKCAGDTKVTIANRYEYTKSGSRAKPEPVGWRYETGPALGQYAKDVYRKVYNPAQVTGLSATDAATSGQVLLTWEAGHVHVEKGFAIQIEVQTSVLTEPEWWTIHTVSANVEQKQFARPTDVPGVYTIVAPTGKHAKYRVVALTDALGANQPDNEAPSGTTPASNEATHDCPTCAVVPPPETPSRCTVTTSYTSTHGTAVTVPADGEVDCGTDVSITATPSSGYCFKDPTATDPSCSTAAVTYQVSTDKTQTSKTVTVAFHVLCQVSASVAVANTGSVIVSDGGKVACGDSVTITVDAADDYCFARSEPSVGAGGQSSTTCTDRTSWDVATSTTKKSQSFTIYFTEKTVECTVTASWESDHGTVVMDPTDGTVTCGTAVSFEVTPSTGYCFRDPTATDASCSTEAVTYDVSTDKSQTSKTVTVAFEEVEDTEDPEECTVTTTVTGMGTAPTVPADGTVDCGEDVTVNASASTGYCYTGHSPGGPATGSECKDKHSWTVTTDENTTSVSIAVDFQQKCQVAVTAAGTGTVSMVPANGTVACGKSVTIQGTASDGYCFDRESPAPLPTAFSRTTTTCKTTYSRSVSTSTTKKAQAFIIHFRAEAEPPGPHCHAGGAPHPAGSGTVTTNPSSGKVTCGQTITVTATAASGYCYDRHEESISPARRGRGILHL